jgi:hypothetical protein
VSKKDLPLFHVATPRPRRHGARACQACSPVRGVSGPRVEVVHRRKRGDRPFTQAWGLIKGMLVNTAMHMAQRHCAVAHCMSSCHHLSTALVPAPLKLAQLIPIRWSKISRI